MRKNKTVLLCTTLVALLAVTTISGCNKDDNNNTDLTTGIVGHYTGGSGSGAVDITVTKIDNNTISITVDPAASNVVTFATTEMSSTTAFTLNNTTVMTSGGTVRMEYSNGSGSYSANNIVVSYHEKSVDVASGSTNYEDDDTYTATK